MSNRPERLEAQHVTEVLGALTDKLASAGLGVTLQSDANGAWGPMGRTYVTLRFCHGEHPSPFKLGQKGDFIEVRLCVDSVRNGTIDHRAQYDREYPK